jgi:hypothetical protein
MGGDGDDVTRGGLIRDDDGGMQMGGGAGATKGGEGNDIFCNSLSFKSRGPSANSLRALVFFPNHPLQFS